MKRPTITLVIPCFNEASRLQSIFKNNPLDFFKTFESTYQFSEIIFVNDGSTDRTVQFLRKTGALLENHLKIPVHVLTYKQNRGRGYALKFAAKSITTDYMLFCDADFSIPLSNLKQCIPHIMNKSDLIIGSKKMKESKDLIKRSPLRKIAGLGHSVLANFFFGTNIHDFQGGFKLFSKRFIDDMFPLITMERWGFDLEVVFLAHKLQYKTREVPVIWAHVENGSSVHILRDSYRGFADILTISLNWTSNRYSSDKIEASGTLFQRLIDFNIS